MTSKHHHGYELLVHPPTNKSTAFTLEERESLGLRGLLPAQVRPPETQVARVMNSLRRKSSDLERYIALQALQNRNERLFYRALIEHIEELMPMVYTPTVGQACKEFAHILNRPQGFYVSRADRGHIRDNLDNWPHDEIKVAVITDGERILGLGDLGTNGMGIPIGKLALYTACGGIAPENCLPIMLDVGTNNEALIDDPFYLGTPAKRLEGEEYAQLIEETIVALTDKWPNILIQFEDFTTPNAIRLLERYRDRVFCFNDDIQGTAAVTLAGLYASTRVTGLDFSDLRVMFLGAGSAAIGIADLLAEAFIEMGLSEEQALQQISAVDSSGLIVNDRETLAEHKQRYARDGSPKQLLEAIRSIKPHVLIGATATPGTFTREVVETMASLHERPTLFALSNPTSRAECTAEQAYEWSDGRALFASGSPFDDVEYRGQTLRTAQANNAYIFPGLGLGAIAAQARRITTAMILDAAKALANQVSEQRLAVGALYPELPQIRRVSANIAAAVAKRAVSENLARITLDDDVVEQMTTYMYDPSY